MRVFVRALGYATLFIATLRVFVPNQVLSYEGIRAFPVIGVWQEVGMLLSGTGAAIALWCIFTFVFLSKGTPAPFDPPRRLVVRGRYRVVRNPMYVGAGLALAGAALFYMSLSLLCYAILFVLVLQVFVVAHEEPALRHSFGDNYAQY